MLTFVKGPKGIPQLIVRNYLYVKHYGDLNKTSYWKCRYYDRGYCKARCKCSLNEVVLNEIHNHEPDYNLMRNRDVLYQISVSQKYH